ncbi:helix-turn-helix domain-containing protein [Ancrocorticia populi]
MGRPPALSQEQAATVRQLRNEGRTIASIARVFGVSRRTIQRELSSY